MLSLTHDPEVPLMSIPPLQDPGGSGQQTNPTASSYDFPEAPEGT